MKLSTIQSINFSSLRKFSEIELLKCYRESAGASQLIPLKLSLSGKKISTNQRNVRRYYKYSVLSAQPYLLRSTYFL